MEQYISEGKLAPDEIVIGMIGNYVAEHKDARGCIFDGFPRTTVQAEAFDKILAEHGLKVGYYGGHPCPGGGAGAPYPAARQGFRAVPTTLRRR